MKNQAKHIALFLLVVFLTIITERTIPHTHELVGELILSHSFAKQHHSSSKSQDAERYFHSSCFLCSNGATTLSDCSFELQFLNANFALKKWQFIIMTYSFEFKNIIKISHYLIRNYSTKSPPFYN